MKTNLRTTISTVAWPEIGGGQLVPASAFPGARYDRGGKEPVSSRIYVELPASGGHFFPIRFS